LQEATVTDRLMRNNIAMERADLADNSYGKRTCPLSWPQDHPLVTKTVLKAVIPSPFDKAVAPIIDNAYTMPAAVGIRRPFHDAGFHPVVPLVARIEEQKDADTATIRQLLPL
jgi:hypothetical protein